MCTFPKLWIPPVMTVPPSCGHQSLFWLWKQKHSKNQDCIVICYGGLQSRDGGIRIHTHDGLATLRPGREARHPAFCQDWLIYHEQWSNGKAPLSSHQWWNHEWPVWPHGAGPSLSPPVGGIFICKYEHPHFYCRVIGVKMPFHTGETIKGKRQ